jgi:hypothetical protein
MRRLYLAGPMTDLPELNFPAFHAEAARLRALGYTVINPAEINSDPTAEWIDCMCADIPQLIGCDGIEASMGLDIDGPLFATVWKLFDAYTGALAVEVGDFTGWLEWYQSENAMGANGLAAGYDGQLIAIQSLDDLYRLIELSRDRGQPCAA